MDADDDGAALVDAGGDPITLDFDGRSKCVTTSVELVAGTLADAACVVPWNEGLVGVAAQAPTEIATKAATLALTTTDECPIERLLGLRQGRPPEGRSHSADTMNGRDRQGKVPSSPRKSRRDMERPPSLPG